MYMISTRPAKVQNVVQWLLSVLWTHLCVAALVLSSEAVAELSTDQRPSTTGGQVRSDRWQQPLHPAAQHSVRFAAGGRAYDLWHPAADDGQNENSGPPEDRCHSAQNQTGCGARHVHAHEEIRFAPFLRPSNGLEWALLTVVPSHQGCLHSLRMPICVAFTLKTGWFWTMSDTEGSSRWPRMGWRLWPSPQLPSLAHTIPSRPCTHLSFCCGATGPMCPSLLVE